MSMGVNVRSKQEEEANMQQEELSRLFSTNMSLSQASQHVQNRAQLEQHVVADPPAQQQQEEQQIAALQPIVYASQHYTHSYHVVPTRAQQATKTEIDSSELLGIFLRNSVDPSLLFPSQLDLFQNADDDQRLRLLELWRISPPQGRQGYPQGVDYNLSRQLYDWPPTSLAQEEAMAKLRFERNLERTAEAEDIKQYQSMSEDTESAAVHATRDMLTSAEPYIVSGYDMLARRDYAESAELAANHLKESTRYNHATDPVYSNGRGNGALWEKNGGTILDMENQYGAFAQAREGDVHSIFMDDEMVM